MSNKEMYLIEKKGYYYRPGAKGYTALKSEAGRYTFEEAAVRVGPNGPDGSQDGMSMWLETNAPEYSSSVDEMTKLREENRLLKKEMQNENQVDDIQMLMERVSNLEEALRYLETRFENDIERIKDTIGSLETSNDWRR
jgi:hypothetical protein